ncbi:DNA helicase [Vibrio phage vB_VcorM_GR11A]|nr:DNA helicase [Vibrio phage vB_VcorM_GR11A]
MALLYDKKAETRALVTITDGDKKLQSRLLGSIDPSFFFDEANSEAMNRIMSMLRSKGEIPKLVDLCSDPTLSEDVRDELADYKKKPIKDVQSVDSVLDTLVKFRRSRLLFENAERTIEMMQGDALDVDDILEQNSEIISQARATSVVTKEVLKIGKGSNSKKMLKKLLDNKKPDVIPTGFDAFDEINGGLFPGSLFVVAATSGGGKSTMAGQLAVNFSERGHPTCMVPLEMTEEEMMSRIVANVSGVDVRKFLLGKLSKGEKKKAEKAFNKYEKKLDKIDSTYGIFEPEEDMSAEEILMMLKPYGYKVIIIDYISLLKGVDGDDSWQQLGKVARFCKIWAKNNNAVVILLAQLSDEGAIRYSRAIIEHANNAWFWTMTDEDKEKGIAEIRQAKARNHSPHPFPLQVEFASMRFRDVGDADLQAMRSEAGDNKRKKLDDVANDIESYLKDSGNE